MSITAYPLRWPDGWPRSRGRKSGQFGKQAWKTSGVGLPSYKQKANITIADAMERVKYELERLGINVADDSIVSTNLKLNLSGLPRGDQGEPSDPGAAVYFQKKNGPMRVIAIDAYTRVRDNIAAIAATLEAMRAIERHGGAQILERAFTGFDALPPPKGWQDILDLSHVPLANISAATIENKFRELARRRHPDVGGSDAAMAELNRARDEALKALA